MGEGAGRQQAIMRLERALYEYFVAGIKTNISLFQRILRDADFQAGKLDTGYLDRLLAKANAAIASSAPERDIKALEKIAVIAAGMFAVLDPASPGGKNGGAGGTSSAAPGSPPSHWEKKGRSAGRGSSYGL